jgi:arylsulfatase
VFKASKFLQTFAAYPPSQKAPSFSVDQIMEDVKSKIAIFKAQGQPK